MSAPSFQCIFCHEGCFPANPIHLCFDCSVSYRLTDDNILERTIFHLEKGNYFYHIELCNLENKTEVRVIAKVADLHQPPLVISVNSLMSGVNPQNAMDKLKTLLIFS